MAQELRFSIGANIIIWLSVMNGKKKNPIFSIVPVYAHMHNLSVVCLLYFQILCLC